jgi:drug/metabolite transporter (DMT)-like permease
LESVTDAARTLLVACALSVIAATTYVTRMRRHDPESHERLIGELRAANIAAILLAATGASTIGFTIANGAAATAALELAIALLFVGVAGAMFFREPRQALWLGAVAFLAHAILDLAHRPGGLSVDLIPRWYLIGCALYDGCVAALCFRARQR